MAGGVALGSFHAGAYDAFVDAFAEPDWIIGASIGAVTAALIAGSPPGKGVEALRQFWEGAALPSSGFPGLADGWTAVLTAHLFGRPGLFQPQLPVMGRDDRPGLYSLAPLRARLEHLIDFERLNSGAIRLSMTATDVESGERVVFDTARGDRIGATEIVASCAFLPLFAPVERAGRLLADGGFAGNLPVDLVVDEPDGHDTCLAVDLFASDGPAPDGLLAAAARAGDLLFGNQSRLLLEGCARTAQLRQAITRLGSLLPAAMLEDPAIAAILAESAAKPVRVLPIAYRALPGEPGPAKGFDFSARMVAARWKAGQAAMEGALLEAGLRVG